MCTWMGILSYVVGNNLRFDFYKTRQDIDACKVPAFSL
jgi:hypothetical protein